MNISNNKIVRISGLKGLDSLRVLECNNNYIETLEDCQGLEDVPALENLDLKNNRINDNADDAIEFFFKLIPKARCMYFKGNGFVRKINHYRKRFMRTFPELNYLDERPIAEFERTMADAWRRGGEEEEAKVMMEMREAEEKTKREKKEYFKKAEEEGKKKRKELFKKMIDATKERKAAEIKEREVLQEKLDDEEYEGQ